MDAKRVLRFDSLVNRLKSKSTFFSQAVQGFRVEASRGAFSSTGEVKTLSGTKLSFSGAFARYDNPYEYLRALMAIDGLARSDIYRLLIKISYRILNRDGFEVSGGERSEYRLLQQIQDAQNFEVLLIDEPESSFDNLFLKSDVNQLIKDIAQTMPVVVVTHNSTVGASIQPNYLLFASKESNGGNVEYSTYSGYPTDKLLLNEGGRSIRTHDILLNSLEAGAATYKERGIGYEAIKD